MGVMSELDMEMKTLNLEENEETKVSPEVDEAAAEARRKAEHEAAEAKRKAEWEAKQNAKQAALRKKKARVAAMTDDEVMMAAMKQVGEDTEKLVRRNMKLCVSEFIQTECLADPAFARAAMTPPKSMVHCFQYINRQAMEYLRKEMENNGEKPVGIYGGDVPDELVYDWAKAYFLDPAAKEDEEKEEKFTPKPYQGKTASSNKKGASAQKKAAEKKPAPKEDKPKGQDEQMQMGWEDFAA